MRAFTVYFALGLLVLSLQGALAVVVRPPWCPDFGLLVVMTLGLRWRGLASGLCLAALLGFCTDLLSGSLLGQQALLRILVFAAASLASRQLDLRGSFALLLFAFGVCVLDGLCLLALSVFFVGAFSGTLSLLPELFLHAAVNALFAPAALALVVRAAFLAGEDEVGARTLQLSSKGRVA